MLIHLSVAALELKIPGVCHAGGSVDLVVADVAGQGIGPSLIMASVKAVMPFVTAGLRRPQRRRQDHHPALDHHLVRRDAGEVEVCGRANRPEDPSWKQQIGFVGEVQGLERGAGWRAPLP